MLHNEVYIKVSDSWTTRFLIPLYVIGIIELYDDGVKLDKFDFKGKYEKVNDIKNIYSWD